jgi:hypothetical protein
MQTWYTDLNGLEISSEELAETLTFEQIAEKMEILVGNPEMGEVPHRNADALLVAVLLKIGLSDTLNSSYVARLVQSYKKIGKWYDNVE